MKTILWKILCIATTSIATAVFAQGPSLLVESPNDSGGQEGNAAVVPPLTGRYQQVYSASDFAGVGAAGGGSLRFIGFRVDAPLGFPFVATFTNVQINFSTTQRGPDSLSPVFADNVGPDDAVAFTASALTLSGGGFPMASPAPYEMLVVLNQPYFYNPANGNLLLDVRRFGTGGQSGVPSLFDGWERTGDSVSRVIGGIGESVGTPSTIGVVTEFGFVLIPEPSSLALLALSFSTLLMVIRKRSQGSSPRKLGS